MFEAGWITTIVFLSDLLIRIGISIRVIMRRLPVGVALAWLSVVLIFPFAGSAIYMTLGEYRLGRKRTQRLAMAQQHWRGLMTKAFPPGSPLLKGCSIEDPRLAQLAEAVFLAAPLPGNRLTLLEGAETAFPAIIADIDAARETCDLEFYIWAPGGRVDEVANALERATKRGVRCRLLVDAMGSSAFLKGPEVEALRDRGIAVEAALPAGLASMAFVRPDLRLHRKIVVIDRRIAYTGSMNMADPRTFKQNAGVGQWIDALARIEGAAVHALAASFLATWCVETGADAASEWSADAIQFEHVGTACVQVLPSGPAARVEAIEQVVLTAVYSARKELVLTTPYFVPSESLMTALLSAAGSGVKVTLIVPAEVDSRMVGFASRAYQTDLVAAGVNVALYEGGLLHTKSITVDGRISLFGSLNLDPRSLRLNFEITLAIYDTAFTAALKDLQQSYVAQARQLDLATCLARRPVSRLVENTARLLGPVL